MLNGNSSSNLNHNAKEFVPEAEAKQMAMCSLRNMIETLFETKLNDSPSQLDKFASILEHHCHISPAQMLCTLWIEFSTSTVKQVSIGFQYIKALQAKLSSPIRSLFETALLDSLKSTIETIISDNTLDNILCNRNSSTETCQLSSSTSKEHVFALITFLRLIITNLNRSDYSDDYASLPPIRACKLYCFLLDTVYERLPKLDYLPDTNDQCGYINSGDYDIITKHDRDGLLYNLFDGFYQGLPYFNSWITQENMHVLCGEWQRTCSLDENPPSELTKSENHNFCMVTELSTLLKKCLVHLRELLINQRISVKLVRSTILDILLYASELAALQNTTSYPMTGVDDCNTNMNSSHESSDDFENAEYFEQFLKESGQIP